MKLKTYLIYLDIAKPFLWIGNYFYNKHVMALRKSQGRT
jgi:hypothetical protein